MTDRRVHGKAAVTVFTPDAHDRFDRNQREFEEWWSRQMVGGRFNYAAEYAKKFADFVWLAARGHEQI